MDTVYSIYRLVSQEEVSNSIITFGPKEMRYKIAIYIVPPCDVTKREGYYIDSYLRKDAFSNVHNIIGFLIHDSRTGSSLNQVRREHSNLNKSYFDFFKSQFSRNQRGMFITNMSSNYEFDDKHGLIKSPDHIVKFGINEEPIQYIDCSSHHYKRIGAEGIVDRDGDIIEEPIPAGCLNPNYPRECNESSQTYLTMLGNLIPYYPNSFELNLLQGGTFKYILGIYDNQFADSKKRLPSENIEFYLIESILNKSGFDKVLSEEFSRKIYLVIPLIHFELSVDKSGIIPEVKKEFIEFKRFLGYIRFIELYSEILNIFKSEKKNKINIFSPDSIKEIIGVFYVKIKEYYYKTKDMVYLKKYYKYKRKYLKLKQKFKQF